MVSKGHEGIFYLKGKTDMHLLEWRPLTHMSWVYRSEASLLAFHAELTSSDVRQYTLIKEKKHIVGACVIIIYVTSLQTYKCIGNILRMLTRQCGVCACLMRQNSSYR